MVKPIKSKRQYSEALTRTYTLMQKKIRTGSK